jgi:hypothetical protein
MRTWKSASVHNGPRAYLIHFRFSGGDERLGVRVKGCAQKSTPARSFRFFIPFVPAWIPLTGFFAY